MGYRDNQIFCAGGKLEFLSFSEYFLLVWALSVARCFVEQAFWAGGDLVNEVMGFYFRDDMKARACLRLQLLEASEAQSRACRGSFRGSGMSRFRGGRDAERVFHSLFCAERREADLHFLCDALPLEHGAFHAGGHIALEG